MYNLSISAFNSRKKLKTCFSSLFWQAEFIKEEMYVLWLKNFKSRKRILAGDIDKAVNRDRLHTFDEMCKICPGYLGKVYSVQTLPFGENVTWNLKHRFLSATTLCLILDICIIKLIPHNQIICLPYLCRLRRRI